MPRAARVFAAPVLTALLAVCPACRADPGAPTAGSASPPVSRGADAQTSSPPPCEQLAAAVCEHPSAAADCRQTAPTGDAAWCEAALADPALVAALAAGRPGASAAPPAASAAPPAAGPCGELGRRLCAAAPSLCADLSAAWAEVGATDAGTQRCRELLASPAGLAEVTARLERVAARQPPDSPRPREAAP